MVANEHFITLVFLTSNTLQTCQILSKLQTKLLIRIQLSFFDNFDKMTKYTTLYKLTKR